MEESKDDIIVIEGLNKSFGEIKAVNDLSFKVKRGELFAFLGVNGAGKSTTISIMCGSLSRDGGTVIIDGVNIDERPDAVKSEIGVVFQSSGLDKQLSVSDNLKSRAALYGICGEAFKARLNELTDLLDLQKLLRRPLGKLSGGQRRRIDIARALIHKPRLLVLDEPTTGLDPQTRKTIWRVVEKLRRDEGMTVFLTTHYMEEAADADYVVILSEGKKVAEGTPIELKNKYTGDFVTIYGATEKQIQSLGIKAERRGDAYRIAVPDTAAATALITAHPDVFTDYEVVKGKMDDVFLAVTGTELAGE
ncbi:ABC transporter ATP-binding protein [Pumilibacter intestinalis]|mgnify:FL=1|jgi:multidrug/hemolysin transport system ATP-binding protein|uniref:ABC transporter ATP-binding protein n=1 Tax=Pumilibacter intestinalis TaxID=2941511 RepID=UPI00203FB6FC|nr:ABC transporter ATP-binding protein [Pumilibacter intestinalis]